MERKDVTIHAPVARAVSGMPMEDMQHHCPLCNKMFSWDEFQAHAQGCIDAHPEKVKQVRERR